MRPDCRTPVELACEQALLFLRANGQPQQWIGLERLYQLLSDPETRDLLEQQYRFTMHDFVDSLSRSTHSIFRPKRSLGRRTATYII